MADGSVFASKNGRKRPRIAFTGEEFGFGYQAVNNLVDAAKVEGVLDAGQSVVDHKREEREVDGRTRSTKTFCFAETIRQPLRSKEQALMAVRTGTADFAVVPFYNPYAGYDFETLRALSSQLTLRGVGLIEATDQLCLAVHESQVLELAQSAHPHSTLSSLLSRGRSRWGSTNTRSDIFNQRWSDREPGAESDASGGDMHRGGIVIDQSTQLALRDRLDAVFADSVGSMRCKSKLDGLRAAGVDVKPIGDVVEPHREFAKLSRQTGNPDRMVNTFFDPVSGDSHYVSAMNGASQNRPFYGVVLPFEVADRSSEYIIVDPFFEDSEPGKTRFMVVQPNVDHTMFEDAYRTTDAKTRYWIRRLQSVANDHSAQRHAAGVRVLLKFRRDGTAASIGDVENYLRNYGVRHAVVRSDEDSERANPAPIMLDIEFETGDFDHNIVSMFTRRLRGSVANGAVKKAFQRWKNRGVLVLAVMPFTEPQLPKHTQRRWWKEAVGSWAEDFAETMFVRLSRILFWSLPVLIAVFAWLILRQG
ncbi:MAG: hypothetical protein AAGC56_13160 [Pseudomonadota bacterium]